MKNQMPEFNALLGVATRAALAAGNALASAPADWREVIATPSRDVKIRADMEAERLALDVLQSETTFAVLAEEQASQAKGAVPNLTGPLWIVDALDGTFNYLRGMPASCCSIALVVDGQPVLGVVNDFVRGEHFSGAEGLGCRRNGEPVFVSDTARIGEGALMTGLPAARDFSAASLSESAAELGRWRKVRMIGSAALSLAYVACGRADAYHEQDIRIWDVAAGLALVRAAGGDVTFSDVTAKGTTSVWATNGQIKPPRP